MRIVIETEQPGEGDGSTRSAGIERQPTDFDGGPAPAVLLRRFGRIPEFEPESEGVSEEAELDESTAEAESRPRAGEREGEQDEEQLNPLRRGAAIAAQRGESKDAGTDPRRSPHRRS
jgi:hypothetical protein